MQTTKAAGLLLDHAIYPRHQISDGNVASIVAAMQAGVEMPPVVADRKTKIVTDGFHRVTGALKLDAAAVVSVLWRSYRDRREMLLDAIRLNSAHGQRLTAYDHARCAVLAREFGVELVELAVALNVTPGKLDKVISTKLATSGGAPIPIKRTARHLAGREITASQIEGNRKAVGHHQLFLVNQLLNLVDSGLLDEENPKLMDALRSLNVRLERVFSGREAA